VENRKLKIFYRKDPGSDLEVVGRVGANDDDKLWDIVRVIAGTDEGITLQPGPSGHIALRRFNLASHEAGEVIYENPTWDVDQADLDDNGKPLAVHFTDDKSRIVWLDPAMAQVQERLEKALGSDEVRIAQRSEDGRRMLITRSSASDPGTLYIYYGDRKELKELSAFRPGLDAAALAQVKAVNYAARDGTKLSAYLTLPRETQGKPLPLIVMPHGGPYGIRDSLAYSDEVQLLASRGYAVLQPNYRGSGGYGKSFEELGKGEIGRRMQDDLDDAVEWAVAQGIADPAKVCLVGESYGGYAALWGVIRNPERYRCAASFAGVTEWDSQLRYDGEYLKRGERRSLIERIRGDDRKFDLASVSPARQVAQLHRPVLLAHGKNDTNVPFSQFEVMRTALTNAKVPGAEYLVLADSGHGFATAKDEQAWYDALVAFLAKNNPAS
jgi:dipeptidyl aminopeptidase/acylaminoacyl peptidase